MTNPFLGLVSDELKLLHYNLIESLIDGTALPCKIYYAPTSYTTCDCVQSSIGNKSSNHGLSGGPQPFRGMSGCPSCNGVGRVPVENSEDIDLAVIWSPKQFLPTTMKVNIADGYIQTISRLESTLPQLRRANYIVVNTNLSPFLQTKFMREGEGCPIGFDDSFCVMFWKKV